MILITKLKSFLSSIPNYELPLFIQQRKLDTKIFYAKTRPQKIKYFPLLQITTFEINHHPHPAIKTEKDLGRKVTILTFDNISMEKKIVIFGDRSISTPIPKRVLGEESRGKEERRSGGMAQMLPRYLGDVIWPRHRGMWECRRGIIRVSETEEKIGDSRSTRRCHEGAWMLACRSISILCFHLPSLVPCYSIRRPRGNSIIISTNLKNEFF